MVEHYYPPIMNLRRGQMLWFAVANDEKGIARLLKEADKQGGTLAESDVSLILPCSLTNDYSQEYHRI